MCAPLSDPFSSSSPSCVGDGFFWRLDDCLCWFPLLGPCLTYPPKNKAGRLKWWSTNTQGGGETKSVSSRGNIDLINSDKLHRK